jgi:hypothetical protein
MKKAPMQKNVLLRAILELFSFWQNLAMRVLITKLNITKESNA